MQELKLIDILKRLPFVIYFYQLQELKMYSTTDQLCLLKIIFIHMVSPMVELQNGDLKIQLLFINITHKPLNVHSREESNQN